MDDHINLEDLTKVRLRFWLRLLKTSRGVESQLRDHLRSEFNSTLPRFDVMAALYRYPEGLRMSDLSSTLKVSNGNVTGIVDRLVKEELVSRKPVPDDRRALLVELTHKGRNEFIIQAGQHEKWVDDLFADVPCEDLHKMMTLLELVAPKLEQKK